MSTIILWILVGFVSYSLIVLVLVRLALKKEDGKLKIKKDNFFIYYFYKNKKMLFKSDNGFFPDSFFPQNRGQLYAGIYRGILWWFLACFVTGLFLSLLFSIGTIVAFMAGYRPTPIRFMKAENYTDPFKKMKCGIAPWKIILPVGFIVGIIIFHKEIWEFVIKIPEIVVLTTTSQHRFFISVAVLLFLFFVFLFFIKVKIWETKLYKKTKKVLAVSFVKKYLCKEIEIED